jgi:hypothetical protein
MQYAVNATRDQAANDSPLTTLARAQGAKARNQVCIPALLLRADNSYALDNRNAFQASYLLKSAQGRSDGQFRS